MSQKLILPVTILFVFWSLAITLWQVTGRAFWILNFGYLGTSLGFGMALYGFLPRKRKPLGRKVAQVLVGMYMIGFLGLAASEHMQIEGFFFSLLGGFLGGSLYHYGVAKVFGPLIFNRGWCAWGCWTAMVLDFLPFVRSTGWVPGKLRWLRYVSFATSFALVALLWFAFGYAYGKRVALYWLIAGNVLYYAVAIAMAFLYKDNRAFCKYLCPITVILKATSRFSVLKIEGNAKTCTGCAACTQLCPMSIDIPAYIKGNLRVLSTECTMCQTCISICATESLKASFGFEMGGKELLAEKRALPVTAQAAQLKRAA